MTFRAIGAEVNPPGIGTITLRRPEKLNALTIEMRREISACLGAWAGDAAVQAVIFTGAGRAFSAGFDMAEFRQPDLHDEILRSSTLYHRDVWTFPKPTIAAVNGPAAGGGFDLASLCDLRLCSESAWFSHPELQYGAPPLFTPLRWLVGDAVARDLCLTRRRVEAAEAARLHIVREVVPAASLMESARGLAALVLEAPGEALRFAKARMSQSGGRAFDATLADEHDRAFRELILSPKRWG